MGINPKIIGMTICEDCPCFIRARGDEGCDECSLGYYIDYENTSTDTKYVKFRYVSPDCGLEVIKYSDGEFSPVKF